MKLYDFRMTLRRAEFSSDGLVSIHFGGSDTVYAEQFTQATFHDARAALAKLSEAETRPHVAMLGMKSGRDRKPPGFSDQRLTTIYRK